MISRRGLLANLVLLGAGGAAVWYFRDRILWAEPQPSFELGGSSGWLPFASARETLPTMKATINGRQIEALLDSGAQYSVIDRKLADELALPSTFAPIVAVGVGGQPQMGRGATADVTVGALTFQALKTGVLELGPIASPKGLGTPLILGQDVLRQVVADIDFPGRRVMLAAADEHQLPEGALAAPVFARGRALAAQIFIGSTQVEAVIDTGASVVLALSRDIAEGAGMLKDGAKVRSGQSVVLGGAMAGEIVRLEAMAFAGQVFTDVDVMLFQGQKLPGFPKALIGVGALRRFRAILDHAAGEMHLLKPGRS